MRTVCEHCKDGAVKGGATIVTGPGNGRVAASKPFRSGMSF
jgi:hypothetical protein